ncbi:MAG: hypothetical protein ABNH21_06820 [Glaciecola sp.]|jgi:hypothetical protein
MTNKLEQNKAIIANAPEGASHIEEGSSLFIKVTENDDLPFFNAWWIYEDGSWVENDSYNILLMRKIDDIRENIALQERIAELEKQLKPRLFWDADNTETSYDSVCELMQARFDDGLAVGDAVEIQSAALLPNETYVLTKIIGDYDFEYELKGGGI